MPYFKEEEQDGEQDRRGFRCASWDIVRPSPQKTSSQPEGEGRHAISPEQPVEDRRSAQRDADDPRLPGEAGGDDERKSGDAPTSAGIPSLMSTNAAPSDASARATVSSP